MHRRLSVDISAILAQGAHSFITVSLEVAHIVLVVNIHWFVLIVACVIGERLR
jgi:hypothetical protein